MSRWSLANYAGPISLEQFQSLVCEFGTLIEHSFTTAVRLEVRAMSRIKKTSHYLHDDWIMDGIAQDNRDNTFYTTTNVMAVDCAGVDCLGHKLKESRWRFAAHF